MKDNEKQYVASGAMGGAEALGVAFVVLKLCNVIEWSWFWVTAPFWMPFAAIVAIVFIALIVMLVKELFSSP